jgi:hypothetical protein
MYSAKSYLRVLALTPVIVILLTIGWYQTSIDHKNFPDKDKLQFDQSFIVAGYFVSWYVLKYIYDRVLIFYSYKKKGESMRETTML